MKHEYELPELMRLSDGSYASDWASARRDHLAVIADILHGHAPVDHTVGSELLSSAIEDYPDGTHSLNEHVRIYYGPELRYNFDVAIARPDDSDIHPLITWNQFKHDKRCPVEREAIARGYAIASFDKEQLFHDDSNARTDAKDAFPGYDWASIRIWGWAHSKVLDYAETTAWADKAAFIATGHSRGGKAALAAAVYDERFRICAPNNSGCGGAGCFRYLGGRDGVTQSEHDVESLGRIAHVFPLWFSPNLNEYGSDTAPYPLTAHESNLPFDLHTLKALIAPRALITMEGLGDTWSNPYGSFITWKAAQPAFDITGVPQYNNIWYREGGHDFGAQDWHTLLDFCDWVLKRAEIAPYWNNAPFND